MVAPAVTVQLRTRWRSILSRKHRPLRLPIQWHHPAQQAPGLRYIDPFGGGNVSDRPKLALIEQALPVVRQPQRAYQWRVLRSLALGALCCGLLRERLRPY